MSCKRSVQRQRKHGWQKLFQVQGTPVSVRGLTAVVEREHVVRAVTEGTLHLLYDGDDFVCRRRLARASDRHDVGGHRRHHDRRSGHFGDGHRRHLLLHPPTSHAPRPTPLQRRPRLRPPGRLRRRRSGHPFAAAVRRRPADAVAAAAVQPISRQAARLRSGAAAQRTVSVSATY